MRVTDIYSVFYKDEEIGVYYVFSDGSVSYNKAWMLPEKLVPELKKLGLDKDKEHLKKPLKSLDEVIKEENLYPTINIQKRQD